MIDTNIGPVRVSGRASADTLSGSLEVSTVGAEPLPDDDLLVLLELLGWQREDLHPEFAPAVGNSGNLHPVLVAADAERLATLDYPFDRLQQLCRERNWITLQLIAPLGAGRWLSRNPFPWGGVVEDPATGSAAAAFVGYLRARGGIESGEHLVIEQGMQMGRASELTVTALDTGAKISGAVVPLP